MSQKVAGQHNAVLNSIDVWEGGIRYTDEDRPAWVGKGKDDAVRLEAERIVSDASTKKSSRW